MFEVKEDLTIDNILSKLNDYSIFKAYCRNFKDINQPFISEFRQEEIPSCRIIYSKGKLWYKDFGETDKAMDCFSYVMKKYNCSFRQALGIINLDFNLGLKSYEEIRPSLNLVGLPDIVKLEEKRDTIIKVERRRWAKHDVEFWNGKFKIEKSTLDLYRVFPIKYYIINDKFIATDKHCYAYFVTREDGINYYKIYSPYSQYKWISNCKSHHYQGYDQLPWLGDILIVTKSLKDVMELYQFGYNSIAPASESQLIGNDFFELLSHRFKRIIMFFDNDGAGIKGAKRNCELHNLSSIMLPIEEGEKDISDYIKTYGVEKAKLTLNKLINGS